MRIYIIRVNGKLFKAFTKKEDAEKYYKLITGIAHQKLIQHLATYSAQIDLITIPVDEDDSLFHLALNKTVHSGAGSWAQHYEYEPFPIPNFS
jgi:hypothetical protein